MYVPNQNQSVMDHPLSHVVHGHDQQFIFLENIISHLFIHPFESFQHTGQKEIEKTTVVTKKVLHRGVE